MRIKCGPIPDQYKLEDSLGLDDLLATDLFLHQLTGSKSLTGLLAMSDFNPELEQDLNDLIEIVATELSDSSQSSTNSNTQLVHTSQDLAQIYSLEEQLREETHVDHRHNHRGHSRHAQLAQLAQSNTGQQSQELFNTRENNPIGDTQEPQPFAQLLSPSQFTGEAVADSSQLSPMSVLTDEVKHMRLANTGQHQLMTSPGPSQEHFHAQSYHVEPNVECQMEAPVHSSLQRQRSDSEPFYGNESSTSQYPTDARFSQTGSHRRQIRSVPYNRSHTEPIPSSYTEPRLPHITDVFPMSALPAPSHAFEHWGSTSSTGQSGLLPDCQYVGLSRPRLRAISEPTINLQSDHNYNQPMRPHYPPPQRGVPRGRPPNNRPGQHRRQLTPSARFQGLEQQRANLEFNNSQLRRRVDHMMSVVQSIRFMMQGRGIPLPPSEIATELSTSQYQPFGPPSDQMPALNPVQSTLHQPPSNQILPVYQQGNPRPATYSAANPGQASQPPSDHLPRFDPQ